MMKKEWLQNKEKDEQIKTWRIAIPNEGRKCHSKKHV
jgi:hypothetical protein